MKVQLMRGKYLMPLLIAQYLTQDERQAMIAAEYDGPNAYGRRTAQHCCPLGIALRVSAVPYRQNPPCPTAHYVGRVLSQFGRGDAAKIAAAASEFMHLWDSGELPVSQLPSALDVAPRSTMHQ